MGLTETAHKIDNYYNNSFILTDSTGGHTSCPRNIDRARVKMNFYETKKEERLERKKETILIQ